MIGKVRLPAHTQRVYVDTNIWIYWIEAGEPWGSLAAAVFDEIEAANARLVTSTLARAEALRGLRRRAVDGERAALYRLTFDDDALVELVPPSPAIVARTIDLPWLKLGDALHAATAVEAGCDVFLTNDRAFARLGAPRVVVLSDLAA